MGCFRGTHGSLSVGVVKLTVSSRRLPDRARRVFVSEGREEGTGSISPGDEVTLAGSERAREGSSSRATMSPGEGSGCLATSTGLSSNRFRRAGASTMIERLATGLAGTLHRASSPFEVGSSRPRVSATTSSVASTTPSLSSSRSSVPARRGREPAITSSRPSGRVERAIGRRRDLEQPVDDLPNTVEVPAQRFSMLEDTVTVAR